MAPDEIREDERRHNAMKAAVRERRSTPVSADAVDAAPPKATEFVHEPGHFSSREEECAEMVRTRKSRRSYRPLLRWQYRSR